MNILSIFQKLVSKTNDSEDKVILSSHRVYILPTREGIIYAILIFFMLLAGINYNNSLVFFFTFLLTGVGLISMQMTQKNLLNLQFNVSHVKPVFCSQNIQIPLIISHSISNTPANFSINIQLNNQPVPNNKKILQKDCLKELTDVFQNEKSILSISSFTSKRGYFNLPSITVSTKYPLGLFRAWAIVKLNSNAIVYPKPAHSVDFIPDNGSDSEGISDKGRGYEDFSGFKSYHPGESLNHIHWKAYAKEQGLLTKIFYGSNSQEYWLKWSDFTDHSEQRLSRLCRLIIDAEIKGDRYGLKLPNLTIQINNGKTHQHQCLKALALFTQ
jgi:uncharacterized protein (DUF58 family)